MNKLTDFSVKNCYKTTSNHYRKSTYPFFLILFFLIPTSPVQAKYSGGTGEPNDPYQITDANDMNEIGAHPEDWGSYFLLVNDINLADYTGTQFNMIEDFSGSFDGNDHSIYNFTYHSPTVESVGLFRSINGPNAIVMNLKIVDPNITARGFIGALAGGVSSGTLNNCTVQGGEISASGSSIGGLVGSAGEFSISNCYSTCNIIVSGSFAFVGGLIGNCEGGNSSISNCQSSGNVTANCCVGGLIGAISHAELNIFQCSAAGDVNGNEKVGGLIGDIDTEHCLISDSFATGNVTGQINTGGLIGENMVPTDGMVSGCYATGNVDGNDTTGGLIGSNHSTVSNCYTLGTISGKNYTGGLMGENRGSLSQCYAIGNVTGEYITGGLVGENRGVVSNSYSIGNVNGNYTTGGLFGTNCCNLTTNCYSGGVVTGPEYTAGGFVGDDIVNSYNNCFWDKTVNSSIQGVAHPICIDFPQYCLEPWPEPQGLVGKSTAEMQNESTFTNAGWDFVEIWDIGENQTYPYLRIYPAGDLNHDGVVNLPDFAIFADHWLEGK